MAQFSWSDSLRAAFSPCAACFGSRSKGNNVEEEHGPAYIPRARPDELEGLLADTEDAETLSMHSNVGSNQGRRRTRHKKPSRVMKLFGFYLFGRPAIQLPEDEDASYVRRGREERARTISASTLDSDASPLDPSAIDELSAARLAARAAQQREEERIAKEERRRRRKEKKELERAALAMALNASGEDFEGFQGSGEGAGLQRSVDSDTYSSVTPEDFGPFQDGYEPDAAEADFGAEHYTRRPLQSGSSVGSGSRSRSSHSVSSPDPTQFNHHYISQQPQPSRKPRPPHMTRSSRHSTSSTSQSASVPSPAPRMSSFPAIAGQEADMPIQSAAGVYTPRSDFPSTGFPITGLRRKNSEAGVFLARRGDE